MENKRKKPSGHDQKKTPLTRYKARAAAVCQKKANDLKKNLASPGRRKAERHRFQQKKAGCPGAGDETKMLPLL